jgi:hypothetical protein
VLESDQALLPERDAGIAADRRGGCRVVEADPRRVLVDDGDRRGLGACQGGAGQDEGGAAAQG